MKNYLNGNFGTPTLIVKIQLTGFITLNKSRALHTIVFQINLKIES